MAPNQGPSVFPITLPTVLGDALKGCPRILLALPIGFRNGSESRPIGFPNRSSNRTRRRPDLVYDSASSKPTTEFAQPHLSRSNSGHPQREGANLGVCLFLYCWSYAGVRLQVWLYCSVSFRPTQTVRSQKGLTKPRNQTNRTKKFSEQFEGVTGHYPIEQGFSGKSHQKVHQNVQQNPCHTVSLWYLLCPYSNGAVQIQLWVWS